LTFQVAVPGGLPVELSAPEARELVAMLWGVSRTQGAVVAIGRLNYRLNNSLGHGLPPPEVELSEPEARAVKIALEAHDPLPQGLAALLQAVSGPGR